MTTTKLAYFFSVLRLCTNGPEELPHPQAAVSLRDVPRGIRLTCGHNGRKQSTCYYISHLFGMFHMDGPHSVPSSLFTCAYHLAAHILLW